MNGLDPDQIHLSPTGVPSVSSDAWALRLDASALQAAGASVNEGCNNVSSCDGSTNGSCSNYGSCVGSANFSACYTAPYEEQS